MSDIDNQNLSTLQWPGLHSKKFRTNRSHKMVPTGQMNFRFQSTKFRPYESGRKHFQQKITIGGQETIKKYLKTFQHKYQSNVFHFPIQKKLIKIIPSNDYKNNKGIDQIKQKNNSNSLQIGISKIKALQQGNKSTGIYRNFYNASTLRHNNESKSVSLLGTDRFNGLYSTIGNKTQW